MADKKNFKAPKKAVIQKKSGDRALFREVQRKRWARWVAVAVTVIFIITTFLAFGTATFK